MSAAPWLSVVPEDESLAMTVFAKVLLDVVSEQLRGLVVELWHQRYPEAKKDRNQRPNPTDWCPERGNEFLFGKNYAFTKYLGRVSVLPGSNIRELIANIPHDVLYGKGQLVKLTSTSSTSTRQCDSFWLVVDCDYIRKSDQTKCTLQLRGGDYQGKGHKLFAREYNFMERQMNKRSAAQSKASKDVILTGNLGKFDLTLVVWMLLNSAHDGLTKQPGEPQPKCTGLLPNSSRYDRLRQELADCREGRKLYAHAPAFKMARRKAVELLTKLRTLMASVDAKFPDLHTTSTFDQGVLEACTVRYTPAEHTEYHKKFLNHVSRAFVEGGPEVFDRDVIDAVVSVWDELDIYLRDPTLRETFLELVRSKAEASDPEDFSAPESSDLEDLEAQRRPQRRMEAPEEEERGWCTVM